MSRISKELAETIAIKMTQKSKEVSEKAKLEYQTLVTELYAAQTPSEVLDVLKKFPDWVTIVRSIRLNGHGFQWESVKAVRNVVSNSGQYEGNLKMTPKIADQITKAKRKMEKANKDYTELKQETINALLSLKTFAQIKQHLPLAEPFLPPPISNALVVNFDSLEKRLKRQDSVTATKVSTNG